MSVFIIILIVLHAWGIPPVWMKQDYPLVVVTSDQDQDGIDDLSEILQGAKRDIASTTVYDASYYADGYPPVGNGACTDVIWRSLRRAGYELKALIDQDIAENTDAYPVEGSPDPNIDFRRVKNLLVFFQKYATPLTTDVIAWDQDNLSQWQGGDIVVYGESVLTGGMHIGIVSDRRTWAGVPYLIHNFAYGTKEENMLTAWPAPIVGHFRFPAP